MSIDFDKLKKTYDKVMNKKGDSIFWKPKDGEQIIRIIPTEDGNPFKPFWFHYGITKGGFLSPSRNFDEYSTDPLTEFVRGLFDEGTEDSIKMAKKLMAKQRFFTPVIVRGEEDKGVRLWGYGKKAFETLVKICMSKEYGDVTDVDKGLDLKITYGKPPGAQFPMTDILPVPSFSPDHNGNMTIGSPASSDSETIKAWKQGIPDYDTAFERKTPEEVGQILDNYLKDESEKEDVVKYGDADSSASSTNATSNDVESKFAELMSQ